MYNYIDENHPDAFMDMEVKKGKGKLCPVCKGHGGWNLRINAYGPKNHFSTICGNCMGSGYISKDQSCTHTWKFMGKSHSVIHYYVCVNCGAKQVVDASD